MSEQIPPTPGAPESEPTAVESPRRRRGGAGTIAAVVAAVLLIVGGGVGLAAYRALSGGGAQPEKYAPASSFAFAKIDLDPAASQKLALRRFADKFPSSPTRKGSGDLRDQLLRSLFEDDPDGKVDYDRDVKPWLGDRAGVAGFLDGGGKAQAELIVQYKDRDKAKQGLDRMLASGGDLHYSLQDGYAVLAEEQSVVDEAVRQAAKANLGPAEVYRKDVDGLTGDQVLTAWVDIERSVKAGQAQSAGSSQLPPQVLDQAKGRLAVGLHAGENYLELEGATFDTPTTGATGSATDMIRGLPERTVAALAVGDPGKAATSAFDRLRNDPSFQRIAPTLESIRQETGLRLPEDLATLLGRSAVVVLGSVPSGGSVPDVGLRSSPTDPGAGRKIAEQIVALASAAGTGVAVETRQAGDDVVLAVGQGYAAELAAGGKLGESTMFKTAMGELPDKVSAAAFVDLGTLLRGLPQAAGEDASHLRAFGMSIRQDGKGTRLRLRLVAG